MDLNSTPARLVVTPSASDQHATKRKYPEAA